MPLVFSYCIFTCHNKDILILYILTILRSRMKLNGFVFRTSPSALHGEVKFLKTGSTFFHLTIPENWSSAGNTNLCSYGKLVN